MLQVNTKLISHHKLTSNHRQGWTLYLELRLHCLGNTIRTPKRLII
jgi:hypothetical protein